MKIKKANIIINNRSSRFHYKFIELILDNKRKMTLLHSEYAADSYLEFDGYSGNINEELDCIYLYYILREK